MATQSGTAKGDERRRAILDAARACFLANGFHATSMQDLLVATELSPGAFYRYFPGKEALIQALVGEVIGRLSSLLVAAIGEQPAGVAEALAPALRAMEEVDRIDRTPRLALMIWAEMQRSEALAAIVRETIRPLLEALRRLAEALVAQGAAAGGDPLALAVMLSGILQGFIVQRSMFEVDAATYLRGLRAVAR